MSSLMTAPPNEKPAPPAICSRKVRMAFATSYFWPPARPTVGINGIARSGQWGSVVLPDVPVRSIEQLLVLMEPVLKERLSERQLDLALAGMSALPAVEAHKPDNPVDVVHHSFDDDRRLRILRLFKKLR